MKKKLQRNNSFAELDKKELLKIVDKQEKVILTLQNAEEKYQKLVNDSIDGIYKSTQEGQFLEVNTALVKMLGYDSKEELMQIDINKQLYTNPSERQELLNQGKTVERKVLQFFKKDGSSIWVEDYGKTHKDKNGSVLYHEGILHDVSEKKKNNDILKALLKISEQGYKTNDLKDFNKFIMFELGKLIDTTNFYIAFYNEDRETISIPFITGEEADEEFPIGKSMTGYLIKNKKPQLLKSKEYKKLIAAGEIELIGTFPKVWLGVPLKVDDKVIGAIVVQSYDNENAYQESDIELLEIVSSHISLAVQRKKFEHEMAISKEVLRKVLDNIPIRVYWKDLDSKLLGCNAAYLDDVSIKDENEVLGKTDFELFKRADAERKRADEAIIMLSGNPKLKYKEKDFINGEEVWTLSSKLPFYDENNKVIGIIGTSDDITESIKTQEKLKKLSEEAIAANLSKSMFLSNMSHEIRTPMNAILGYSQLLQDDTNLTNVQQESLKTINKSGEHLLALINDILDMSKIEAGRITLKPADFNFTEMLKEVEQLFKMKAQQKNLNLSFLVDQNIPKAILADEAKIKQSVINLIGNALKFTSEGYVKVTVEKCAGNKLSVKVKDSGKGVLEEEQGKIFKPFEQAQKSGEQKGGTGLGLAISKKFAVLMGGDITLLSEYGKGSEFTFTFSYEEGEENEIGIDNVKRKVKSLSPEMKGLKVAIVDDRFENRDILYKKLHPLGFETQMAENGQEAVEIYKKWKPDIILMDVVMPIMDGVEATRQILDIAGDHEVKIFVVSASALESEQKEIMDLGATIFIKKPVIFNILLDEMTKKANVKFIYSDENSVEEEQNKSKPSDVPEDLKIKLLNAASEGDFMLLEELLTELKNETNKSFIEIEESISEMEFEAVKNWLES